VPASAWSSARAFVVGAGVVVGAGIVVVDGGVAAVVVAAGVGVPCDFCGSMIEAMTASATKDAKAPPVTMRAILTGRFIAADSFQLRCPRDSAGAAERSRR
jgi:hypothetical protein